MDGDGVGLSIVSLFLARSFGTVGFDELAEQGREVRHCRIILLDGERGTCLSDIAVCMFSGVLVGMGDVVIEVRNKISPPLPRGR